MKVSSIDWETWTPEQVATLLFVARAGEVLLIRKKRGLGAGKINGPGGRLEDNETPLECAIRETQEELLISPLDIRPAGELFFHANDMPRIHGHIFVASDYEGTPSETDEAIPLWFRRRIRTGLFHFRRRNHARSRYPVFLIPLALPRR
jgi:8-oxo-dGTP diphosphatase